MHKIKNALKYISSIFKILVFTSIISTLHAQALEGIVAVVEDKIILQSDLDIQASQAIEAGYVGQKNATCEVLNQLIIDKIFVAQAGRDSVEVTQDEVNQELNRRLVYFVNMFGSEEKLEEYYGKSLFELKEEFRDDIYMQLLSDRMKSKVFADLDVTPKEVMNYFNTIPKDSLPFFNAEVEVAQVVVYAKPTILQKEKAKEKAQKIREDIINGSDFGFQALLYSDDPGSATKDGALGYVNRGELVPEFEAVAFRLEKGEISEVVETKYGFHVIQLLDRKGDRIDVRHILITPDMGNENMLKAQEDIIEIHSTVQQGKISFQKAVALYSEDISSKQNGGLMTNPETGENTFEMSQLDGNTSLAITNLNVGEISEVLPYQSIDGSNGFRFLYLQSESPPHQASLKTDYNRIKNVAKQAKQNDRIEKWLIDKVATMYVKVKEDYNDCDLISNTINN